LFWVYCWFHTSTSSPHNVCEFVRVAIQLVSIGEAIWVLQL